MRRSLIVTALLATHLLAQPASARSAPNGALPARGLIAFAMAPALGFAPDIYVVRPDGSGLTRLTESPSPDHNPSWSPNGARIAFERDGDIYTMDANGENERNLTETPDVIEREPDWSPDGTRLVFSMVFENDPNIVTMDVDGSKLKLLDFGGNPSWSPDGTWIAYDTAMGAAEDTVRLVRSDGGPWRDLRDDLFDDEDPAWSPDGRRIAYIHDEAIAIARRDGSRLRVFFWDMGSHTSPSWAPRGRAIAFIRDGALYTFDPRDGVEHRIEMPIPGSVIDLDWGPGSARA